MRLLEQAALALEEGNRPEERAVLVCLHARGSDGSTHLLRSSLMGLISILRRPMARACIEQRYVWACIRV